MDRNRLIITLISQPDVYLEWYNLEYKPGLHSNIRKDKIDVGAGCKLPPYRLKFEQAFRFQTYKFTGRILSTR
jgi:hypothetical protein